MTPRRHGPARATAVALDARWLRVVQTTGGVVTALAAIRLDAAEDPAGSAQHALRETGLAVGSVQIVVPAHELTTRLLEVPSRNPQEIQQIVALQVEKVTPHGKEEILSDFTITDSETAGYSRVLLAVVHQEVVLRAVKVIEGLGGIVERVGCEVEGVVRWAEPSAGVFLLVEIGREAATLAIAQRRHLLFHRSIPYGLDQLAAGGAGIEAMITECQRSLESYELGQGPHPTPQGIVLTGLADQVPGIAEVFQRALNVPAQVVPALGRCPVARAVTASPALREASFAGLVGLAVSPGELDLTPPHVRLRQVFVRRAVALVGLGSRLAVAAALLVGMALTAMYREHQYHGALAREQQAIAGLTSGVTRTLGQLRLVKRRLSQRGQLLDVLETVSRLAPVGMELASMTFTAGEAVVLRGVSPELPMVYEFVSALGSVPLFQGVEARRVSQRKVEGQDVTEFEVVCGLPLPGGA